MDACTRALELLPEQLKVNFDGIELSDIEELRIRLGKRLTVLIRGEEQVISDREVNQENIDRIMEKATGASMHAIRDPLRAGYLSYHGLRIGICGMVSCTGNEVEGFRRIQSLAVRIPREFPGLCNTLIAQMYPLIYRNTLIISPPGIGKTTALRDMIRGLSNRGLRLAVADERNELSAFDEHGPGFDLGDHTDVLIGTPKSTAAMMLLRGMNPDILAMDEISSSSDIRVMEQLVGCGVGILSTAHADDRDDLFKRPLYRRLMDMQVFSYILTIRRTEYGREYCPEKLKG